MNNEQKTIQIDADGRPLGRLASEIAVLLMGKLKTNFVPHLAQSDLVHVKNVEKIKLTGNKLENKIYYRHSNYPGGLKETKLSELMEKSPDRVLLNAVKHMLPANRLRKDRMKKIKFI